MKKKEPRAKKPGYNAENPDLVPRFVTQPVTLIKDNKPNISGSAIVPSVHAGTYRAYHM
jgi:hypothetical protein